MPDSAMSKERRSGASAVVRSLLIVDDHPLMCDALALTLQVSLGLKSVATERSLQDACLRIAVASPDAVILDVNLPDAKGIEGVVTLRRLLPSTPITLISADRDPGVIGDAITAGANGFLAKTLPRDELVSALQRIWSGEMVVPDNYDPDARDENDEERGDIIRRFATLTPQQLRILREVCMGKANKEISYDLSIAEATVKTHLTAIMSKIDVRRRTQAVRLANIAQLFNDT
ncbi:response regulator transcription factor [Paracoccus sp. S1E-3]|uniref:response regulator transcription factor n=1 Tax=Paracoccus sp. S1E-3 TaxID=2756130 RepID=UPI00210258E6|nr:response regulator transcription factor [Paracoccus sp. S1E-3]